jgi:6-phosphogluconolactonase
MSCVVQVFLFIMSSIVLLSADNVVFIGTDTSIGSSRGIYAFHFDSAQGAAGEPSLAANTTGCGFLVEHPTLAVLYSASSAAPSGSGAVTAYSINAPGLGLTALNTVQVGAPGAPCHVAITADGQTLLATYYNTGIASALSVQADGRLGTLVSNFVHQGPTGPNTSRQDRPHAHSFTISPDGRYAYACDLGMDRIVRYALDPHVPGITQTDPPYGISAPGVGPRHAKFTSDGRHFYVLNELAGSLDVFSYDSRDGRLLLLQTISTLPAGFTGTNTSAEVRIHGNGRFVYASNRGPDTLAVFQRDEGSGLLTLVEQVPSGGQHPRNFALSPDSAYLLCANRDSNNIVVFKVNEQTGRLVKTATAISVPSPICVLFAR